MQKLVIECNSCGKQIIVKDHIDSTGMVHVSKIDILAMNDIPMGKAGRESLFIEYQDYCPGCLLDMVALWISKISRDSATADVKKVP
jgi:hypothetical protein